VVKRLRTEFMFQGCVNRIECVRTASELSCTQVLQIKGRSEEV
jgi:hypothetical protein